MTTTLIQNPTSGVLLKNISWQTYEFLVQDLAEQPGIRLTYDRGTLEIMTPLDPHKKYKKILGRFVETLSEELDTDIYSLGSRTCKREDLERGLEPDQCYYIQNEDLVWNKEQIDLNTDPPPDLVIEIDIASSSINRLALYASLSVAEVWRYDGTRLIIYQLQGNEYAECNYSPTFPFLPQAEIERFLELRKTTKEKALLRLFREWIRSQIEVQ
ncbi:Uma2 family endonuclease [Microcoleus sp. FACHB-672]|uniref:Uma2 family endonuclease n=1 Tax=Microcoleus sp. FACHB-672 TaxID=2692825 RepID=UPI00168A112D|nr:Uma2 family endonuclease [Microcoleus sp. FACHB-672]MBD2043388.1 Uma2 family endonuclease [Microcoleus sp. FACHB-672]